MRQMKDSGIEWIGEIPKNWEVRKIKTRFAIQAGFTPDTKNDSYYNDSGYDWVNISDLVDGKTICISNTRKKISREYLVKYPHRIVKQGSLLYSFKLSVGQTAFAGKDLYTNEAIASILPTQNDNLKFLNYATFLIIFNAQTNIYGAKILNQDLIKNAVIVFPSIAEQQKIADFLDGKCAKIDSLIAHEEATIEELKAYKQSVITEAVTKGLDKSVPMKDSGVEWIGEIPESWSVGKLKNICNVFGRIGFRGYRQDDLVSEGEGAITLSPSNMKDMKMNYEKCSYLTWEKYFESPEIQIKNDDILFVKTGSTFGKVALVENLPLAATVNPQIIVITNFKIFNKYLCYFLCSPIIRAQIDCSVVGGTIPTISQEKILNYSILIPTSKEQKQIAEYLDKKCAEIDSLISIKQNKIEELKEYKKSLIYEYVTGKKEVA